MELVALAGLLGQLVGLLLEKLERVSFVDALALRGCHAVADPLPELTAGDFGGGGILPVFHLTFSQEDTLREVYSESKYIPMCGWRGWKETYIR